MATLGYGTCLDKALFEFCEQSLELKILNESFVQPLPWDHRGLGWTNLDIYSNLATRIML